MPAYLARHGRPIRYGYVPRPVPLAEYQTVFARTPGSAEMPSAGRPFTDRLVTDLVTRGIAVVPITLHTGVSSQEPGEPPQPERYAVTAATARLVNAVRAAAGRVVAVGTTATRALESATDRSGPGARPARLDRSRPRARAPCAGGHRAGDRLARARRVAPGAARGGGRDGAGAAGLRRRGGGAATCGTSSATAACCCRERPVRTALSAASHASCSRPLLAAASVPRTQDEPSRAVKRPPASVTTGARAAMSHSDSSGSAARSTAPSASSM